MARSLYRALNMRYGARVDEITRREMLRTTAAAGAALLLSGMAGGHAPARPGAGSRRCVVIGAGLAGLSCSHELRTAGYDVIVLEARERVGGRVLSFNRDFGNEFVPWRNVEGGGEFIGTNHPLWCAYAAKFGFEQLMIREEEGLTFPVVIDGKRLDDDAAAALWDSMGKALNRMNALAQKVDADRPWESPGAKELDGRTIQSWIDALDADELTKKACWINQAGDNGVDPSRASLLGQLTAVKGGGLERFWTETEAWRCKGGNARLARELFNRVQFMHEQRVHFGTAVSRAEARGKEMVVTCKDGRTFACDDVVLGVPPSVWAKIAFEPGLPAGLSPQMGMSVKYLAHTKTQFWRKERVTPDALSNGPVQMTWNATEGQGLASDEGCLTAFSGGTGAEKVLTFAKEARDAEYAKLLGRFYPSYNEQFVKARFMDWTKDPWTMGSYSFPAPGQVTAHGPLLASGAMEIGGQARLHFAGEHACYKFVGYMEGALQSGVGVARRLAARDGIVK